MAENPIRTRFAFCFALLFWSCDENPGNKTSSPIPKTGVPDSTRVELSEIYSEVINSDSLFSDEKDLVRILGRYVEPDSSSMRSIRQDSGVEKETLEDFGKKTQAIPIDGLSFSIRARYIFYFENPEKGPRFEWSRSSRQFRTVTTIGLSKVGFDKERKQALVYVEDGWNGHHFYSGYFKLLTKTDGKWEASRTQSSWLLF